MSSEIDHEAIPVPTFDYKAIAIGTMVLVALVIAYYFVRRYVPNVMPTTLHVVEQAEESEAGA